MHPCLSGDIERPLAYSHVGAVGSAVHRRTKKGANELVESFGTYRAAKESSWELVGTLSSQEFRELP